MGAGEEGTPTKSSKLASSPQKVPMTPVYPDWLGSMQAFYGSGPTLPFFASTVASPTPHPYVWGSQHPMMPHFGTPVPYPALYPPRGVYAHPNMRMKSRSTNPMTPGTVHGTAELDGKATEGKDLASSKKIKGASGNHGRRKTGELHALEMMLVLKVLKARLKVHQMQLITIITRNFCNQERKL